jgi:hypothetical protein
MSELESYEKLTEAEFVRLATKYHASFIVTKAGQTLSFAEVHGNRDFRVYDPSSGIVR